MKPYLTIEEIISMPRLSQPAVSEDGHRLAWVETTTDWDKNEYRETAQIFDARTKTKLSLEGEKGTSNSPAWSVTNRLAWLSPHEEVSQVFVLVEGKPIQITSLKTGVISFQWAPDGNGIYFLTPDPLCQDVLEKRKETYGDFSYAEKDRTWNSVYFKEVGPDKDLLEQESIPKDLKQEEQETEKKLLGDESHHILGFSVSPDRKTLAVVAAPSSDPESLENAGLYLFDTVTKELKELPVPKPIDTSGTVLFSPTGNKICYGRPVAEGKWFNVTTLEFLDLERGDTSRPLLHLDESPFPVRWTEKGLVFTLQRKTDSYLYMLDNEGNVVPLLDDPGTVTFSAAVNQKGDALATLTATRDKPFEIYLNGAAVTNQNRYYESKTLSRKEVVTWQSEDGTQIEGILITASDMDESKPHPLLVVVHGGPSWAAFATPTSNLYYPYEQFVERGFILLDVNYRGSSGYGDSFRKLNFRNLGIGDYEDVISGVDMLVRKGLADKERVGIMGWSQGGYISAMCATYSNRFRAVSVGAGISNWYTYYVNTDITPFTRHYLGDTPWNDPEIYSKTSPITYIHRANTPTLIQHGDQDPRVPYPNAKELYRGLKDKGVPVELVTFKGMGHNPKKPGFHRAIMKQNLAWFCHYLLDE